jgi:hypothetical protein
MQLLLGEILETAVRRVGEPPPSKKLSTEAEDFVSD